MPTNTQPTSTQIKFLKPVFLDPNSFATTLVTAVVDLYGTEAFSWAPETLLMELEEDMGFPLDSLLYDRLMAGIFLIMTNRFYKSLPDFNEMCLVLSGASFDPSVFQPADSDDCAWGITEALLLAPPDEEEPFTNEIRAYIGYVTQMEGIITPPDILRIAMRDEDLLGKVQAGFSDDPEMSQAIWAMEASKTEDINNLVKERLQLLIQQLANMRLRHGNTTDVAKRLLSNLKSRPAGGSPLPG
jgi:hypothetical protein